MSASTFAMPVGPASGAIACRAALAAGFDHVGTAAGDHTGERVSTFRHPGDGRELDIYTTDRASLIRARVAGDRGLWPAGAPGSAYSVPKVSNILNAV